MSRTPSDPRHASQLRTDRQAIAAWLLERCAEGDQEALAELHDLFAAPLLRVVRGMVRRHEEAEEVVQEVFLYVWRRADHYDSRRAAVSTWLRRIASSRAIDHLRKKQTRARLIASLEGERVTSVEPRVEQALDAHRQRRRLRRALEVLPSPQLQAVLLAYYGELTQSEIAAHSRIPLGTVKTRTHLAFRKLRAELGGSEVVAAAGR